MNEIQQQIKFLKSRLNWDADVQVMGDGESKYFLNTVPEDSEHIGARTNCLGTVSTATSISTMATTNITVVTTYPTSSSIRFDFDFSTVNTYIWIEIFIKGKVKHLYIPYATSPAVFMDAVLEEVRKHFSTELFTSGQTTFGNYYVFEKQATDVIEMKVRRGALVTYPSTLKVIGTFYDKLQDIVYYWTYDIASAGKSLFQFVRYANIISELPLSDNDVNQYSQVTNAFTIGQGKNTLLYWCYKGDTVRKINIYNCLTGAGVSSFYNSDSVNIIKPPPFKLIAWTHAISDENNYDQYFQLLVRSKFIDKEKSVFGALSPLIYPAAFSENTIGMHGGSSNMRYDIQISNDSHYEWSEYEYALKANADEWKEVKLKDSTVVGYTKELTGNDVISSVAPSDINRLFDYVPQKIGQVQILNNNRIAISDCTEGYINTAITATLTEVNPLSGFLPTIDAAYQDEVTAGGSSSFTMVVPTSQRFAAHALYIKTTKGEYYAYLPDDTGLYSFQVGEFLANYVTTNIIPIDPAITSCTNYLPGIVDTVGTANCLLSRYIYLPAYLKTRSFPQGTQYLGIVYFDKFGRCGGVNIGDGLIKTISATAMSYLKIEIYSQPPEWAYYYKIFYGGCGKSWYQQLAIKKADVAIGDSETAVFVNNAYLSGTIINSAYNVGSYVWNKGDRIRFLQYDSTTTSGQLKFTEGVDFTTIVDLEILSQDESAIYIPNIHDATVLSEINGHNYYLIELYTPVTGKPVEYLETPHWGYISSPGTATRYHNYFTGANPSYNRYDQTAVLPMTGTMDGFDHVIRQTFYIDQGIPVTFWCLSESISNYFPSKTRGLGRVNFYSPDFNTLRRNVIRVSNVYIPQTDINGLSTFEYANEVTVDESYGPITDIKLVGDVLKVIQPHNISSIYLGAEIGTDANGGQMMLRSDKILSTPRYNALKYGSLHPESIVVHNAYMYALDVINSVVWRDTPGGTFAISDNGMRSYFKYKVRQLLDSCGQGFRAVGCYDYLNEMYLITFKDPYNSTLDETLGFHEPSESWYSFYSFTPENYCSIPGDYTLSFNLGRLYAHSSATRNNFYGTQYTSKAWVVANQYPDDPKKFNSISINSNDIWDARDGVVTDSDMVVHQDPTSYITIKGAMTSILKEKNFRYYNGEYRAEFLRDAYTSSSVFKVDDLINGRALQGKTLIVKLVNDNTSAVYLRGVRINAQTAK